MSTALVDHLSAASAAGRSGSNARYCGELWDPVGERSAGRPFDRCCRFFRSSLGVPFS